MIAPSGDSVGFRARAATGSPARSGFAIGVASLVLLRLAALQRYRGGVGFRARAATGSPARSGFAIGVASLVLLRLAALQRYRGGVGFRARAAGSGLVGEHGPHRWMRRGQRDPSAAVDHGDLGSGHRNVVQQAVDLTHGIGEPSLDHGSDQTGVIGGERVRGLVGQFLAGGVRRAFHPTAPAVQAQRAAAARRRP